MKPVITRDSALRDYKIVARVLRANFDFTNININFYNGKNQRTGKRFKLYKLFDQSIVPTSCFRNLTKVIIVGIQRGLHFFIAPMVCMTKENYVQVVKEMNWHLCTIKVFAEMNKLISSNEDLDSVEDFRMTELYLLMGI
ncbi:hypothetical protein Glove_100g13 [Diversispora epigaea]|uniref:Uncharacterized protein n=1 Tax=Diversispora epigaea TaxID=1348612 RepID=A0A397J8C9_9GLOM|nr:hypothetical protein Glove_100g13 [Diversispora epigaea]